MLHPTPVAQVQKALETRGRGENTSAGIAALNEVALGLKRLAQDIREAVRGTDSGDGNVSGIIYLPYSEHLDFSEYSR